MSSISSLGSIVHLTLESGKEKGNSKVISSLIFWDKVPIVFIFPLDSHLSKSKDFILSEGSFIFLFPSNE